MVKVLIITGKAVVGKGNLVVAYSVESGEEAHAQILSKPTQRTTRLAEL
jgi:hypothetical protein